MVQKLCVKSICMDSDGHIRNRMDDTIENILKSMQIQIRPIGLRLVRPQMALYGLWGKTNAFLYGLVWCLYEMQKNPVPTLKNMK